MTHAMRVLSIVILVIVSSTKLYGQTELTVDAKYMSGLFQAHQATIDSWRTGDVLIKFRISGTGQQRFLPPGPDSKTLVTEAEGYVRFTFDFDKKRFLVVNRRKQVSNLFDGLGDEIGRPTHSADDSAGVCDLGQRIVLVRSAEGGIRDIARITRDENDFLGTLQAPLVMGVGCCHYPLLKWQPLNRLHAAIGIYGYVDVIKSVKHVGKDRYRATSSVVTKVGQAGGSRVETEWDAKRQVPVSYSHFAGPEADPAVPFSEVALATTLAEWTEMDGHLLPSLGRGSMRVPVDFNDIGFGVQYEYEMAFHWFSINEEIPQETFDIELLKDFPRLMELVDGKCFEDISEGKN
jgi:hypothetical protein